MLWFVKPAMNKLLAHSRKSGARSKESRNDQRQEKDSCTSRGCKLLAQSLRRKQGIKWFWLSVLAHKRSNFFIVIGWVEVCCSSLSLRILFRTLNCDLMNTKFLCLPVLRIRQHSFLFGVLSEESAMTSQHNFCGHGQVNETTGIYFPFEEFHNLCFISCLIKKTFSFLQTNKQTFPKW